MEKHIIHQLLENCLKSVNGHDVTDLKSMEGFEPCQPICFHCFDIIPSKVRPRNAKRRIALGGCWQVERLESLQPCLSMLFDGFHVEH